MPVSSANALKLLLHRYAGAPEAAVQALPGTSMKPETMAVSPFMLVSHTVMACLRRLLSRTFEQGHLSWLRLGTCFSNRMR